MSPDTLRRIVLLSLVLFALSNLYGCGVTGWHQMMDAHADLNSAQMNARIAEARK